MKTYLKLLAFGRPFRGFVAEYLATVLGGVVFGAVNFSLLIPLLNVLFGRLPAEQVAQLPTPAISVSYVIDVFHFFLFRILSAYGTLGALMFICIIIVLFVFLANGFRYWSQRILIRMRTRLIQNLRAAMFDKLLYVHSGYVLRQRKGDLLSLFTNDVHEIDASVGTSVHIFFRDPLTIVGYFVLLFLISPQLTLFTLVLIPIGALVIGTITRRLRKESAEAQRQLGRLLGMIEETISGAKIVRSFNAEGLRKSEFAAENDWARRIHKRIQNWRELASPISETLAVVVVVVIIAYGGSLVLSGEQALSASAFVAYIALYSQLLPPAKNISSALTNIQKGLAAGRRILHFLDVANDIQDASDALAVSQFTSAIEYRNVSFGYEQRRFALQQINVRIDKGKVIALVGPSGSGKTTFVDLLSRFYDPTEGEILLDGIPLQRLRLRDLRKLIGIVSQETILFDDTVLRNIALGDYQIDEARVMAAARTAHAHEFIVRLEQGYHTIIGDRGNRLSGGERQRLTIARAVYKNPPILILDEATSALDTESERLVQDALDQLMQTRTSIVIAHRLSTIQRADEILVMERGRIVERGTHEALIRSGGLYQRLVELQQLKGHADMVWQ